MRVLFCFVLFCFVLFCLVLFPPALSTHHFFARQCASSVVYIPFLFCFFTQQYFPAVSWTAMFFSSVFHPPTRQYMYLYVTPPLQEYSRENQVSFAVYRTLWQRWCVWVFFTHSPTNTCVYTSHLLCRNIRQRDRFLLRGHRSLLQVYRALLLQCGVLLRRYRSPVQEYRGGGAYRGEDRAVWKDIRLFCKHLVFFCKRIGFFFTDTGLFCTDTGLFCRDIGLLCKHMLFFSKKMLLQTNSFARIHNF